MRKLFHSAAAAFLTLVLAWPAPLHATAYDGHPKLIVVIVVDQLRGDEVERYRASYKGNGFRLFYDKGAVFPDCYYDYANTKTAPGHASIATGAYTDGHGIEDNEWWDLKRNVKRPVTSVEDDRYNVVGLGGAAPVPSASPRNLMASTLGDELRLATQGASRVYTVSLKDRAAILSGGAAANGAFWTDEATGKFITSSYYMTSLPAWAAQFNAGDAAAAAQQQSGLASVKSFTDEVGATPAGNDYELAFADALIRGEGLGTHATPDLLYIALSPNDLVGHRYGPDSPQARAMLLGIDASLDAFFSQLDKEIDGGLANVWVALSADHGVGPAPDVSAGYGLPGASINMGSLIAAMNATLNAKFSPGEKQTYVLPKQGLPYLSLDERSFSRAGINEQEAEDAALAALPSAVASLSGSTASPVGAAPEATGTPASTAGSAPAPIPPPQEQAPTGPSASAPASESGPHRWPAPPAIAHAYSRLEIARGALPLSEFGRLLEHSYSSNGGWWIFVMPEAFQMNVSGAGHTTHFTSYSYDRHVPLMFYGAPFTHGTFRGRVGPVDMAVTFASLLGINDPSAATGNVLTQAIHPVAASAAAPPRKGHVRTSASETTGATDAPAAHAAAKETPAKAGPAHEGPPQ